jgi:hypothetical protein
LRSFAKVPEVQNERAKAEGFKKLLALWWLMAQFTGLKFTYI